MNRKRLKQKNEVIELAEKLWKKKNKYVILDTETTGLGAKDVIVQIGIIDLEGNVLLDSLVRPTKKKRISSDATAIHGIKIETLENQPTFKDLQKEFFKIIKSKTVLIYNAEYDARLISQTAEQDGVNLKTIDALCLMKAYAIFVGDWSEYHQDYTYQKLPAGDHSAIGDCKATLNVLKEMAEAEKEELPKKWYQF